MKQADYSQYDDLVCIMYCWLQVMWSDQSFGIKLNSLPISFFVVDSTFKGWLMYVKNKLVL